MKKIAVVLLLLVYAGATTGATIHLHYCMNQFVGSSLWHSGKDSKCGKCGMKDKKGGCCKDEHKQAKLTAEHQKTTPAQQFQLFENAGLVPGNDIGSFTAIKRSSILPATHAPLIIAKERRYLLHGVFLI